MLSLSAKWQILTRVLWSGADFKRFGVTEPSPTCGPNENQLVPLKSSLVSSSTTGALGFWNSISLACWPKHRAAAK